MQTFFFTDAGVVKAVDGLSYTVNKGECVGLVGESGCGKSVSAMSILRLIPDPPGRIMGGSILFKGEELLNTSTQRMRSLRGSQIAMVFQEPSTSLNPVLTVGRQLSEVLTVHRGLDKKSALRQSEELLRDVGIPDPHRIIRDYPHQFSGGMQQRIMIAMALSCNPDLLIADEPTTALDVTIQAEILEMIARLRDRLGIAVVLITHNLGVVARYVQRVNVMYAGILVESAPTEELYATPKHPYTIGLLASVPRLDKPKGENLRVIKGLPPNLANLPQGCVFAPRCEYAMPQCWKERPPLEQVSPGHYRACFYDASKLTR